MDWIHFLYLGRLTPQGIPSGRKLDDILDEVRKEAFTMRGKSANEDISEERDLSALTSASTSASSSSTSASSSSSLIHTDTYLLWFPTEWLAWTLYGPPSDNPSSHWVNEPISEGPSVDALEYVDSGRSSEKPAGRVSQREKVTDTKASSKVVVDSNTLKAARIQHQAMGLSIQVDVNDRTLLEIMLTHAVTTEEKVRTCFNFFVCDILPFLLVKQF